MDQLSELKNRVLKILEEERELNLSDPMICSLLTRIGNKVVKTTDDILACDQPDED